MFFYIRETGYIHYCSLSLIFFPVPFSEKLDSATGMFIPVNLIPANLIPWGNGMDSADLFH